MPADHNRRSKLYFARGCLQGGVLYKNSSTCIYIAELLQLHVVCRLHRQLCNSWHLHSSVAWSCNVAKAQMGMQIEHMAGLLSNFAS